MPASLLSMFSFAGRSNRAGFLATALVICALQLAGGALLLSLPETSRGVAEAVFGGAVTWMLMAAVSLKCRLEQPPSFRPTRLPIYVFFPVNPCSRAV